MSITTIDPCTGEVLATYARHDDAEVQARLQRARRAARSWARTSLGERRDRLRRVAELLREDRRRHAELMVSEMGKPLPQAEAEIDKCAWACDHYVEHAALYLAPEVVETGATLAQVTFRPLGTVLAVMPWNFPYWQVLRFAAPNLVAGNVALLKHADGTTGCSLALEALFTEAGYPEGVFQSLLIDHDVTAEVIASDAVQAVTLTGSTRAGREVGAAAGRALKKTVLELGGSDAQVVLEDADVEHAAASCVASRLLNTGQSCIAAKRWIVVDGVRERFTELAVAGMRRAVMGDPRAEGVDVGPLARAELRDALHDQVQRSVAGGAALLLGGDVPGGPGAWYPPTVLADVAPGMPAFDEELFGPVAAIVPARDEEEALRLANAGDYGLGAAVFTRDVERGRALAEVELEAGSCFVNDFVKSDPRLPFGGVKASGHGRELGLHGFREFLNAKTIVVR